MTRSCLMLAFGVAAHAAEKPNAVVMDAVSWIAAIGLLVLGWSLRPV